MICQLAGIFNQLLETGLGIGRQFLDRELSRDSRRQQKDLLKAQARASGGGSSFVDAQSPGTVSAAFVERPPAIPVQAAGLGTAAGVLLRGGVAGARAGAARAGPVLRRIGPDIAAGALGAGAVSALGLNGNGGGVDTGAFQLGGRFVLDQETGCLRQKMRGEKGITFKIDSRTGDFVRVRARRINPFNKSAAKRASRRIDATINAMADLVRVSNKRDKGKSVGGKVVRFRSTKRKKKVC